MPKTPRFTRASKRSFAEVFYPARPLRLWAAKARDIAQAQLSQAQKLGLPIGSNAAYVHWLKRQSMLVTANKQALKYSGKGIMWRNPYAKPQPRSAVKLASVWYTSYPISMITKPKKSILAALGDDALWEAFQEIGIKGLHTGPMKQAGGLDGWTSTGSIDGHFDRISTKIDPLFGTEAEFRRLTDTATRHQGIVLDDIVPGHTGKGADFRLAELNYQDYPGIYHMVEIDAKDWALLPSVPKGQDSVNLGEEVEEQLKKAGYIVGRLQRVMFYEPGVKETNWSVTRAIRGVDGVKRRWVYLHYFKDGQPSINWLDPSFAGMRLVIGDALHSLGQLGTRGLRLDANGFLGVEKSSDDAPGWSQGHPLSEAANHFITSLIRKMGGFSFQEVNLAVDDIKIMGQSADLSYDFITRPGYHHALATGDTEYLRLMLRIGLDSGVDPAALVHALQNHDELTYELVHFWTIHKDDPFEFRGQTITGSALRKIIRSDLANKLTGQDAPYNLLFTENGISCTTASVIAASLGFKDLGHLGQAATESIKRVHLLLAMFNALQPGVFALSGWDLAGALTLDPKVIPDLVQDGDTRWINRGAYDLMGDNLSAKKSSSGMPKTISLYGTLPGQLANPNSFASRLKQILAVREAYGIATSRQLDIPDVNHPGLLAMVHSLGEGKLQITALNFSDQTIKASITSSHLPAHFNVTDMFNQQALGQVSADNTVKITLEPYQGTSLLIAQDQ